MTRGKFTPEVGSFAMEVWGEIGGGKMPLTGGEKTLLCKGGEEAFEIEDEES